MGENSKIGWTHHTWNLWRGCTEVSPACDHCYARELAKRNPAVLGQWGRGAPRVLAADGYRKLPLKWNQQAAEAGERRRVFALSMGDWLDDEVPVEWLSELLRMVYATENLDWLLLTKRPENFFKRIKSAIRAELKRTGGEPSSFLDFMDGWACKGDMIPKNVWIGTTVENQLCADYRIPQLLAIPARVRFLSCEPIVGEFDFSHVSWIKWFRISHGLSWVIAGGESGPHARPVKAEWIRSLRDECALAAMPFFFKQWGEWSPDHAGVMTRIGTAKSGKTLDGREWQEFPTPLAA